MMADSKIKVITVTSDPTNQGVHNLIGSLTKYNWSFQVIPCIWQGFGTKIIKTYEYLKEHPEIEHFIFCDANDVVVLGTEEEFITKLFQVSPMLFSTERNCWPEDEYKNLYTHYPHGFNFLNSGLYFAPSKLFIDLVEFDTPNFSMDDQLYFTKDYLFNNQTGITLDNNCDVFQSYSFIEDGDYSYENKRVQNLKTGTQPLFLHFNGRTNGDKVLELLK